MRWKLPNSKIYCNSDPWVLENMWVILTKYPAIGLCSEKKTLIILSGSVQNHNLVGIFRKNLEYSVLTRFK